MSLRVELRVRGQLVGHMLIENDCSEGRPSDDPEFGSYEFSIVGTGREPVGFMGVGRIEHFDRRLGAWELVRRVLTVAMAEADNDQAGLRLRSALPFRPRDVP